MGITDTLRSRGGKLTSAQAEQVRLARDRLGRVYGLRLDPRRLGEDDRMRLVDLVRAATPEDQVGYGGVSLGQLDKGQRRALDRLVEACAGLEKGELAKRDEEAKAMRKIEALAREAMRPRRRVVWEEEGAVTFPASVGEHLRSGVLWLEHVAILFALLTAFERVEAPLGCQFEGTSGDLALLVDANRGLALGKLTDSDELIARWKKLVEHLGEVGYLAIEKPGPHWRIKLGPLATKIRKGSKT